MSKILQILLIIVACQVFFATSKKYYYSPDETVLHNLKDKNPPSYLSQFRIGKPEKEYLKVAGKTHKTTGPIHTSVRTDKKGNVKWGVRHFVGNKYSR
ncbi:unnamed protein product [Chironomus riparius]|uniref:Uncharacterized protein n=1 Tax=Chironomus riparius TaxID=315576 RepID=A0A9N9WNZ0_9DIPT|nr:unnamed protein product [Chironomus riparius]